MSPHKGRLRARTIIGGGALATVLFAAVGCSGASPGGGSGKGATPGYDPATKTFTVTAILPLSGALAPAGTSIAAGEKLYFAALNDRGGVNGEYKLEFKAEDSQYNPQVTVPLYNRIKNQNILISGLLGTAIINTLDPQLKTDGIMAVADSSSGLILNKPNLLPYGSSTQTNMINLAAYAADKLGHKDDLFCSVTQADDLGKENRDGVQYAVKAFGLKFGVNASVQQGDTNFTPQIQQLKSAGCDVVMLGATTGQVPGLISAAVQLDFNAQWMGQSNVYDPSFATSPIAPYLQKHFLTSLIGVDWENDAQGVAQLRDAVQKYGPDTKPSSFTQLGFAHGMLVEAILKKAIENQDLTRAGIMKASAQVGDFDYGGILPKFAYNAPEDRKPPYVTSIFKVNPDKPMGVEPEVIDYGVPEARTYGESQG
ncbi:ABC transporter substrate-binding protein [Streptosporangium sp. CA-115845]|uniref:ABC transporter substrate-binding protein n=1 Tax=Streptosporangium sp. CA-115845 TaxID=3240071 RepID=UPI003D8CBF2C